MSAQRTPYTLQVCAPPSGALSARLNFLYSRKYLLMVPVHSPRSSKSCYPRSGKARLHSSIGTQLIVIINPGPLPRCRASPWYWCCLLHSRVNLTRLLGLSFSVLPPTKPPGSLKNIYKQLATDFPGFVAPNTGYTEFLYPPDS